MKNKLVKIFSLMAVITALMIIGCKKDSTSSPATPTPVTPSSSGNGYHYFYFIKDTSSSVSATMQLVINDMSLCKYYANDGVRVFDQYYYNIGVSSVYWQYSSFGASDTLRINHGDSLTSDIITSPRILYSLYIDGNLVKTARGQLNYKYN